MKKSDYITIQGWMMAEEELSGNELLCYAVIYAHCIFNGNDYYGTYQDLAQWCGVTTRSVNNILKSLSDKGKIRRIERSENVHYSIVRLEKENNSLAAK